MPVMAAAGVSELEKLTRRYGVKLSPPAGVSVEECALVVGEIVGHRSVKSASRINSTVVVFVDSTEKADQMVVAGVVINGALMLVFPLSNPVKKVVVSNVPPFLKNDLLLRELSRHGRVVSPMRLIPLSSKSPLLRHVVDLGSERLTRELVEQVVTRVAETVLDMEDVAVEENSINVSIKRKNTDSKESNSSWDTQETLTDNDDIQVEMHSGYSLSKIRSFLRTTKGMRSVQVEDYFPDLQLFQESTKYFMKTGSFGQELYRLKKLLLKVRSRLVSADEANIEEFKSTWCLKDELCLVEEEELVFGGLLN
ncbi:hypothetical protein D4764_16G0000070 [Takifugu flavidus]|uniref:Uncharacterized protein n=1 Tax=Takifugu flavidus TaxID=433684 RepID=A0A5C6P058_9TELE|nr:hypothetical protein D4764_16G0000070 [Takifugu flavidus]